MSDARCGMMHAAGESNGAAGDSANTGTCEGARRRTQMEQEALEQAAAGLGSLLELCACRTLERDVWGLHVLGGLQRRPARTFQAPVGKATV